MNNEELLRVLNDIIVKNLGHATAYGYAKSKGYTGTEEEFAELMADYAHVAQDAEAAAQAAAESATAAHNSEVNAGNSEGEAEQAKLDAQASAQAADVSEANAKISELNADTHAENSEAYAVGTRDGSPVGQGDPTYHNNAKYYAELADTKADQAAESADTATTKAGEASASAATAGQKATEASASATAADASKTAAKTSEDNAKASETTASNAAVSAMNSRDAAAGSATSAAGSASTATQKATEASQSATSASGSASTATQKATEASQSATSASGSASTATQKATEASNSASAAAQSAADAAESATHVADMALMQALAPKYDSTAQYKIGNLLTYLGKQYYCIADAPAGTLPTNTTYFEEKSVADIIEMIKTGEITVGKATLADNFDSKMVLTDKSGYLFRTAGGSLEIGEQNRVKKIVGASVPIIQLVENGDFASKTGWAKNRCSLDVENGVGVATCSAVTSSTFSFYQHPVGVAGHKFFVSAWLKCVTTNAPTSISIAASSGQWDSPVGVRRIDNPSQNTWYHVWFIGILKEDADAYITLTASFVSAENMTIGDKLYAKNAQIIELTNTFGTTVANRLYALEQAQAGTGIAKAKEILVKDYYPYNVTDFTHLKTSGKVNNGFNQFNINDTNLQYPTKCSYTNGVISNSITDSKTALSIQIVLQKDRSYVRNLWFNYNGSANYYADISTNGRKVITFTLPNEDYNEVLVKHNGSSADIQFFDFTDFIKGNTYCLSFTTNGTNPSSAGGIKLVETNINLHWDGERDGEYEDYQEWNYPVEDIELKGILSLDAQDNWVADGDEYLPSGVVDENYFEQDLGELNWTRIADAQGGYVFWAPLPNGRQSSGAYGYASCRCAKYIARNYSAGALDNLEMTQGSSFVSSSANIAIRDDAYSTASAFKTAVTGLILLFKGATPTTSSADSYTELQNDSNWGTEKWIDERDVPLPVFSTCEYLPDLKAKTEVSPESPDEDGYYIMHRENGLNSYSSLSTWLSANGYNKLQDLSSSLQTNPAVALTFVEKKLIRTGNVYALTVIAKNESSADIGVSTSFLKLPNNAYNTSIDLQFAGWYGSTLGRFKTLKENGWIECREAIPVNTTIQLFVTYIMP